MRTVEELTGKKFRKGRGMKGKMERKEEWRKLEERGKDETEKINSMKGRNGKEKVLRNGETEV